MGTKMLSLLPQQQSSLEPVKGGSSEVVPAFFAELERLEKEGEQPEKEPKEIIEPSKRSGGKPIQVIISKGTPNLSPREDDNGSAFSGYKFRGGVSVSPGLPPSQNRLERQPTVQNPNLLNIQTIP